MLSSASLCPAPKFPSRAEIWTIFWLHLQPTINTLCWKAAKQPDCHPALAPRACCLHLPLHLCSRLPHPWNLFPWFTSMHWHPLSPSPASFRSVWVKLSEQEFTGFKAQIDGGEKPVFKINSNSVKKQLGVLVYTDTENYCFSRGVV